MDAAEGALGGRLSLDEFAALLSMTLEALDGGRVDRRPGTAWRTGVEGVWGEEDGGESTGESSDIGEDSMGISLGVTGLGACKGGDQRTLARRFWFCCVGVVCADCHCLFGGVAVLADSGRSGMLSSKPLEYGTKVCLLSWGRGADPAERE